jgi:GNAT superfamily N-acetyltransferase
VIAAEREPFLAVMRDVYGTAMSAAEFEWWFDRNPVGPRLVTASEDDGQLLGVSAMSFFRMHLGGVQRDVAFAVHAATTPAARGRGVWSALELHNEEQAARAGAPCVLGFTNPMAGPILVGKLGWRDLCHLRIWARPKRLRRTGRGGLRGGAGPRFEQRHAALDGTGANRFVKDAAYLNWRYADSPRAYRLVDAERGYAVLGHALHKGYSAGLVCELAGLGRASLLRRCVRAVDADIVIAFVNRGDERSYLAAGFVPTPESIRFIGKPLAEQVELPATRRAWHFTLGDLDFF